MNRSMQLLPAGSRTKRGQACDAAEGKLPLIVVGDELAAVTVAQLGAAGDAAPRWAGDPCRRVRHLHLLALHKAMYHLTVDRRIGYPSGQVYRWISPAFMRAVKIRGKKLVSPHISLRVVFPKSG